MLDLVPKMALPSTCCRGCGCPPYGLESHVRKLLEDVSRLQADSDESSHKFGSTDDSDDAAMQKAIMEELQEVVNDLDWELFETYDSYDDKVK